MIKQEMEVNMQEKRELLMILLLSSQVRLTWNNKTKTFNKQEDWS